MRTRIALALLALAGCATPKPPPPPPLNVQVESKKAEVTEQSLTDCTLTVDLEVLAPMAGVKATGAHWELVFDGNVIAKGQEKLSTAISNTEPTTVQLSGSGQVAKDAQGVEALSSHKGGFPLALRGTIDFSGPQGSSARAEFAKASNLREPRMPSIGIDVSASHYDDGHVNLTFNLGIDNSNPFPVDINEFKYGITINDQTVIKEGTAGAHVEVPASAKKVFEVSEQLDNYNFRELDHVYKANAMKYRLIGVLDVGLAKFDVDMAAPITFTR